MFPEVFQSSHEISSGDTSYLLNVKLPFPIKLHDMLEEMATIGDESIVSWQPHGMAFRVHVSDVFASTVMPRYFKQTKYKSFLRQLHIYGFHRIGKGRDRGAYFHSMFIRNKKSMSLRMTCKKNKDKKLHDRAAGAPDFYSLETDVSNDQFQDSRSLTNVPRSDPTLQTCTTTKEQNSAFLFNQEVTGNPSPSHQIVGSAIGLVDWMKQAHSTIFSTDEEHEACDSMRLCHGYNSSASSEESHDGSTLLYGRGQQNHGDEGFFEGKKFFDVAVTKMPSVENFSVVVNRGGHMLYMPRSA